MPLDFNSVVTTERPVLTRYFQHAVHDVGLAEDLTQEAFLRAAQGWEAFRGDCSPRTWLRRIAVNIVRDHWRSRASEDRTMLRPGPLEDASPLADPQESPALAVERQQVRTCLGDLVARLPAGEQEAFILAVRDGMAPREIAQALRLAPQAARARLYRARRNLAAMVGRHCVLATDEGGALSCEARTLHPSRSDSPRPIVPPA